MFIAGIMKDLHSNGFTSNSLAQLCARLLAFAERSITDVEHYEVEVNEVASTDLADGADRLVLSDRKR